MKLQKGKWYYNIKVAKRTHTDWPSNIGLSILLGLQFRL